MAADLTGFEQGRALGSGVIVAFSPNGDVQVGAVGSGEDLVRPEPGQILVWVGQGRAQQIPCQGRSVPVGEARRQFYLSHAEDGLREGARDGDAGVHQRQVFHSLLTAGKVPAGADDQGAAQDGVPAEQMPGVPEIGLRDPQPYGFQAVEAPLPDQLRFVAGEVTPVADAGAVQHLHAEQLPVRCGGKVALIHVLRVIRKRRVLPEVVVGQPVLHPIRSQGVRAGDGEIVQGKANVVPLTRIFDFEPGLWLWRIGGLNRPVNLLDRCLGDFRLRRDVEPVRDRIDRTGQQQNDDCGHGDQRAKPHRNPALRVLLRDLH